MNTTNEIQSNLKRSRLLGGVGAVVLGAGLGALFADFLKPYALAVLLTGVAMHAVGMFTEHRFENQSSTSRVWWAEFLYWVCWLTLLGVMIVLAANYIRV